MPRREELCAAKCLLDVVLEHNLVSNSQYVNSGFLLRVPEKADGYELSLSLTFLTEEEMQEMSVLARRLLHTVYLPNMKFYTAAKTPVTLPFCSPRS